MVKVDSEIIAGRVMRGYVKQETTSVKLVKTESGISTLLRSIVPSSKSVQDGVDLQSKSREVNRIWCRMYFRQTVGKHLARHHFDESYFWSRTPLLQGKRFQLDVSRFTSRALALNHT